MGSGQSNMITNRVLGTLLRSSSGARGGVGKQYEECKVLRKHEGSSLPTWAGTQTLISLMCKKPDQKRPSGIE